MIALIAVMVMKGQLKSVRQKNAGAYQKADSLHLTQAYELFLYRNVNRTENPKTTVPTPAPPAEATAEAAEDFKVERYIFLRKCTSLLLEKSFVQ